MRGSGWVDYDAYRFSFIVHSHLLVGKIIEPYLGARLGFAVYKIDNHKIERERPSRNVNSSGSGVGASALAGFNVPLGNDFALYSELSVGADVLWSDDGTENLWGLFPFLRRCRRGDRCRRYPPPLPTDPRDLLVD